MPGTAAQLRECSDLAPFVRYFRATTDHRVGVNPRIDDGSATFAQITDIDPFRELANRHERNDALTTDQRGCQCPRQSTFDYSRGDIGVQDDLSLIHISEPTRRTPISYA